MFALPTVTEADGTTASRQPWARRAPRPGLGEAGRGGLVFLL